MKRKFLLFLLLFFCFAHEVAAFEIVYPKTKEKTFSSPTTFFIGSSEKPLTINGKNVPLHRTGAFAYYVKLKDGINTFTIKSDDGEDTYVINRKNVQKNNLNSSKIVEYSNPKYFVVINDRTPIRSSPVNSGINRISHLQKGVLLVADAENGGFYRLRLNNKKTAWVDKSNVKQTEAFSSAIISGYEYSETNDNFILTFHLDKRVTFEIDESEIIGIKFYNTDREHNFTLPYVSKTGTKNLFGYNGQYVDNNGIQDFILTVRKPPTINKKNPLKGITIVVDPGHGGKENGAIGCLGDKEKDVVLKMAKYLETELKHRGAKVVMTRDHDITVGLYDRVKIANDNNAMLFLSLHNNALPDTLNPNEHRGTSVYYYYDEAKDFADTVLKSMTQKLGTENDGLRQGSFAVVRNTSALSILIEVAYLINPDDNELLIDQVFQKNTAKAIAEGVEKYMLSE